jgi:hypothetical protein
MGEREGEMCCYWEASIRRDGGVEKSNGLKLKDIQGLRTCTNQH